MPIYEYECEKCGHRLEVMQKISEPPRTDCPACSAPALKKLVSAAGFVLKGSGWYVTDFKDKPARGGGDKAAGKGEGKSGSGDGKSGDAGGGGTDSKPAASTSSD